MLEPSDAALDYLTAKCAFDRVIDPETGRVDVGERLDHLEAAARRLAGPGAGPDARLAALRRTLHAPGPWNDHQPFAYDARDPLGRRLANKLLATYLTTRRGNCVSMPALVLILGERLGLPLALATAPSHLFVRYRDERGRVHNLETTSGANPARDAWYRAQMPMPDRAVESGLYLRSLSRREGIALLATTMVEQLVEQDRPEAVLAVSSVILRHAPRDAVTMVHYGSACARLIAREFEARYRSPRLIPPLLRPRYRSLCRRNRDSFAAAEALGWAPDE